MLVRLPDSLPDGWLTLMVKIDSAVAHMAASLRCAGFSLWWFLWLKPGGFKGFQQLQSSGLVVTQWVRSSRIRVKLPVSTKFSGLDHQGSMTNVFKIFTSFNQLI